MHQDEPLARLNHRHGVAVAKIICSFLNKNINLV